MTYLDGILRDSEGGDGGEEGGVKEKLHLDVCCVTNKRADSVEGLSSVHYACDLSHSGMFCTAAYRRVSTKDG